ncbi:phosphodiester glycosidase family protein [Paenibacillus sp. MMS20-IR301]|uniref:phosphodiester glycosidase family protein n=1 Tax=Paenibacillus sp. MMS20-IR301 TaxID=2895946 RepID=UPI0028F03372|nr:phosphodiester glycosidase family protein [Paenibacillus sp. MMS20-IR301]WNS41162.1 phosphodiester glycosidase family protein [Paenibacillus sp. MMS20-IR301]
MKKIPALFTAFCLLFALLPSLHAGAAAAPPKLAVYVDKENHSFIPLRFLNGFAGIQAVITAAGGPIEVTRDGSSVTFTPGKAGASVNGQPVSSGEPPLSENGMTYLPLSLISQTLGIQLQWNKDGGSLTLTSGGETATLPVQNGTLIKSTAPAVVSGSHTYKVGGRSFSVQTVTVSLLHPSVKLDAVLAGNTVGKTEALASIAKRSNAKAAINGTFFDAYTKGSYYAPYGYIISGGKMLKNSPGDKRTVFAFDSNSLAELIPGSDFKARFDAGTVQGAIQAGPRLLVNGKVSLNVAAEGFRDPKILTGGGSRSALGLTRDHKLILLTSGGATIPQLAEIMKQAGAYQAMNLDGGASSGLYYNGKYLTTPGRLISNALVVQTQ